MQGEDVDSVAEIRGGETVGEGKEEEFKGTEGM